VIAAIDRLAAAGARVIKLPLDRGGLAAELVAPAVAHAHDKGLKVAVHALTNEAVLGAAQAGADLLAHTPVEALADTTVAAWRGRAVISTLAAFGGSPAARGNLRRLRAAGVTILYGTDLGNLRVDGPSADEIKLLRDAGLDDAAITAAMTTTPIAYGGLPLRLAAGDEATLLVLDKDPRTDVSVLVPPRTVIHRGRVVR
jgi:imidazolonepropionase-like amidohydrolase